MLTTLAADAWQVLSCGAGSKGERLYEWAWMPVDPLASDGGLHALLFRRPVGNPDPDEVVYSLVYSPQPVPLAEVVRAAGSRWAIERCIQVAKGECGLDQYEVRSWDGWHRHITLVLLAQAVKGRPNCAASNAAHAGLPAAATPIPHHVAAQGRKGSRRVNQWHN